MVNYQYDMEVCSNAKIPPVGIVAMGGITIKTIPPIGWRVLCRLFKNDILSGLLCLCNQLFVLLRTYIFLLYSVLVCLASILQGI